MTFNLLSTTPRSRMSLFSTQRTYKQIASSDGLSLWKKSSITLNVWKVYATFLNYSYKRMGAQEWHIVSLLVDVTSPTTDIHYVSMTSDLRVLSTEKYWLVRRQNTVYTNKSLQCKGEVYSSPLNKQGGYVTSQQWMWDLKRFPAVSWFAHPCTRVLQYTEKTKRRICSS